MVGTRLVLSIAYLFLASTTSASSAGIPNWLCEITGWFFCNSERAGIVRGNTTPPKEEVALARYDFQRGREKVLMAKCAGCRSIAALNGGDLMILGADGLYRWNSRVRTLESLLKDKTVIGLLGRYPKDPDGFLVTVRPTRDGLCPPVFRFDLRTRALQDLGDPLANKAAHECPMLLAGPLPDQFSADRQQLLMTRGGNDHSGPSALLVENLRDHTIHKLVDDPTSALNDGRKRFNAVWIDGGTAIAYLLGGEL